MQKKLIDLKPGKVFVWEGVVFVTTNRKWFNYFSDFVVCLKISDGTLSALDGSLLVEVNYGEDDLELLAIDALEHFGDTAQICQTMEECAELIQALNKTLRHVTDSEQVRRNVLEELADVTIMVEQMKQNFDEGEEFDEILEEKMNKLRGYLENQEADR